MVVCERVAQQQQQQKRHQQKQILQLQSCILWSFYNQIWSASAYATDHVKTIITISRNWNTRNSETNKTYQYSCRQTVCVCVCDLSWLPTQILTQLVQQQWTKKYIKTKHFARNKFYLLIQHTAMSWMLQINNFLLYPKYYWNSAMCVCEIAICSVNVYVNISLIFVNRCTKIRQILASTISRWEKIPITGRLGFGV